MTVPPRAIHTFKNASDTEPAEFFMTATPGKCLSLSSLLQTKSMITDFVCFF